MYKVVSCLFNFKQMRNLPATSFLENKRYGIQAREQGFPKLCPALSESRYRAISWACNEASNLVVAYMRPYPESCLGQSHGLILWYISTSSATSSHVGILFYIPSKSAPGVKHHLSPVTHPDFDRVILTYFSWISITSSCVSTLR